MGYVANILSTKRRLRRGVSFLDVKVSRDLIRAPITVTHVAPPGEDSHPIGTDQPVCVALQQSGRVAAVGYFDPVNAGKTTPGEKRFYARNAAGVVFAEVWLRDTGAVEITNAFGSIKLGSDGAVNAVTPAGSFGMDAAGVLTASVTSLSIGNAAGSMTLSAAGVWTINGVTIDPAGLVTATDFVAGLVTLLTHVHSAGLYLSQGIGNPVTGTSGVGQ